MTAYWNGTNFVLFIADTSGGIYAAQGNSDAGWGPWMSISQGRTTPGGRVAATWDGKRFSVLLADPGGGVFAAFGTPADGWTPWSSVAQGKTIPGGPVTAFWNYNGSQMAIFLTDPNGGVYAIGTRPPGAPSNLRVVSTTDSAINIAWTDDAGDQDGFRVSYGLAVANSDQSSFSLPPGARTASITNLQSDTAYDIILVAFNDATGTSPSVNSLGVTQKAPVPVTTIVANVTQLDTEGLPWGLVMQGSNFAKGEQVAVTVDWTVGSEPKVAFPLLANADPVFGAFQTSFTGNTPFGFCPISVPFGDPQPPQKFQVSATGLTSGKTASATAGPFTCPFSD